MTRFSASDFPRARIWELTPDVTAIEYPAFTYLHAENSEAKPICADKGGRHLGQPVPGISVPFPTRRHGMLHKSFGIGFYEGGDGGEAGEPYAYGTGAMISNQQRDKEWLAGAMLGDAILLRGRRYRIERAPNDNIALVPAPALAPAD